MNQIETVRTELLSKGYVTRNEMLSRGITRLGGVIYVLREKGMEIEGRAVFKKDGKMKDYVYVLKNGAK